MAGRVAAVEAWVAVAMVAAVDLAKCRAVAAMARVVKVKAVAALWVVVRVGRAVVLEVEGGVAETAVAVWARAAAVETLGRRRWR